MSKGVGAGMSPHLVFDKCLLNEYVNGNMIFFQGSQDIGQIGMKILGEIETKLKRQNHQVMEDCSEYSGLDPTGSSGWFLGGG